MCSAPVQVKLQVSLQQRTYRGESSGLVPEGQIISMNTESASSFSVMPGSPTVFGTIKEPKGGEEGGKHGETEM